MIGILTLFAYYAGSRTSLPNAGIPLGETMAFAVLALSQLVHVFNVRTAHSLFEVGLGRNGYMFGATLLSLFLIAVVLAIPFLRDVFEVVAMNGTEWTIVIGLSLLPIPIVEAAKFAKNKKG